MTVGWLCTVFKFSFKVEQILDLSSSCSYKNLSTGKNVSIVAFKGYAKSVDI